MTAIEKFISVAKGELGYLEKGTNASLDSKTANAGYNNYTKYARDIANTDLLNGNKNGYYWCAVFVLWCMVQSFGLENAKKMCGLPNKSCAAGVDWLQRYFRNMGRLYTKPQVGDIVMFGTQHTGIVIATNGSYITTIEGNTSSKGGVVANGGGVFQKGYYINSNMTFGRPKWDIVKDKFKTEDKPTKVETKPKETKEKETCSVELPILKSGSNGNSVKAVQVLLNNAINAKLTIDGAFGDKTVSAVKSFQKKHGLNQDGVVGANTWVKLLK